ncbi:UvrD-helicase domain-containing protein [Aquimarina agarivorans]|uniref:UvrD-helicase domain-containing protein n=1 Tax=Aquimarina agarivorans TaxID=980584 RepID=UPI000248EC4A|nr:UvrD-helicase domain-containing protein [Aquimarina agarivorans]
MQNTAAFTVYDAAAGSGKTYTIVKSYLIKILSNPSKNRYKQILAVTFTNKAVSEMKQRILNSLYSFSKKVTPQTNKSMFDEIASELNLTKEALRIKSRKTLHYLLHNYTAFSVQTIDKFTQSVIRTFAYDLGLSSNFDIELDQNKLLEIAVDNLIDKVGTEPQITKIVLGFTKSKINDDAPWNIKKSLLEIAQIIFKEDAIEHIKNLSVYSHQDFEIFSKELRGKLTANKNKITALSSALIETFKQHEVIDEFTRGSIPKHFKNLIKNTTEDFDKAKWKQDLEHAPLCAKSKSEFVKDSLENLRPEIIDVFYKTKNLVIENQFLERILKNVIQMSLLKNLNDELHLLKKEKQLLLISDFNKLIFETIKDQPTPFIYERLGERYKDFFIDEFQDTSVMQWQNLFPLSDNAVSSLNDLTGQNGTVTIVGDAKQAIYRWRGGKAEQFMSLSNLGSPFSNPDKTTIQLDTNYRSYSNIIEFNNSFFTYTSNFFSLENYKELFIKGNDQKSNSRQGGYIQFDFIDALNAEEKNLLYPEKVLENIRQITANGFSYKEICILVRKNKEGVILAEFLNQHQIPVISQEVLLVKNSNEVQLLINFASFSIAQNDTKNKLEFLKVLSSHLKIKQTHTFLQTLMPLNAKQIEKELALLHIKLDINWFDNLSIYEAFEALITAFGLEGIPNSNLQFFMDFVFDFTQKNNSGISEFITHWNAKKDSLSIVVPEGKNAIQIMSIHKSKGLEFPVVIYPFADTEIYKPQPNHVWSPVDHLSRIFKEAYVNYNEKVFSQYSKKTQKQSQQIQQYQELDNLNILYVALTRAKEQLFIISNFSETKKNPEASFQNLFKDYLLHSNKFEINGSSYFYGNPLKSSTVIENISNIKNLSTFICTKKSELQIFPALKTNILSKEQEESLTLGLLTHEFMAEIYDRNDVDKVLTKFRLKGNITPTQLKKITENVSLILNDSCLKHIFNTKNKIYNERDFVYKNEILRPDRVEILNDNSVVIVDYKTGIELKEHQQQIDNYAAIFTGFGFKNIAKLLIYTGSTVKINNL